MKSGLSQMIHEYKIIIYWSNEGFGFVDEVPNFLAASPTDRHTRAL